MNNYTILHLHMTETIEDADGGWDEFCIVKASFSDECPLELIDEGENDER